jgi:hypothetical protein
VTLQAFTVKAQHRYMLLSSQIQDLPLHDFPPSSSKPVYESINGLIVLEKNSQCLIKPSELCNSESKKSLKGCLVACMYENHITDMQLQRVWLPARVFESGSIDAKGKAAHRLARRIRISFALLAS